MSNYKDMGEYLKVNLPIVFLMYIYFRDHMISGQNKNAKFVANKFMGPMMDLDTDNMYANIQILDGDNVCKKDQKVMKVQ